MTDIFNSPKRRIARAKKHFNDLVVEVDTFVKSNPCANVVDDDGTNCTHKFKLVKPLPNDLSDLAVDCTDSLRSALDQVGYASAVSAGCADPKSTYFPFAGSLAELDNVIARRCRDLPPDIVTLFRGFQPYKGGDDLLWAMNRVRVANQHKILTGTALANQSFNMLIGEMTMGAGGFIGPGRWNNAKQEIVYAISKSGTKFDYKGQFSFFITFWEVEILAGQEVLTVLHALIGKVEGIVGATEAECRRVGLIP